MIFQGALSVMTALLLCTSCSSDDLTTDRVAPVAPVGKVIHYTATVGEGDETRATLDGEKKYVFQTGDKLVITGTDISGDLTLAEGAGTASATFSGDLTYSGSDTPADDLTLNAVLESTSSAMTTLTHASAEYPSTAIASASTDIAARKAAVEKYSYFTATSTYAARSFTVSQQTSFLDFTVTFEDGTASGTEFTIDIKNGGETVRTGSVTTATESDKVVAHFVAAMPKGTVMSSATVQLGTKDAISFGGSKELAANKIYNISKTVAASGSGGSVPEGALSGKFSVASGTQVYFSKGNLRYDGSTWSFFDNQYDYYESHDGTKWDKFGWSTYATTYGMSEATSSDSYSGDFKDWGATIGTGWRTLSQDEWDYLFNTRTSAASKYGYATVADKHGIIILPDEFTDPNKNGSSGAFKGSSTTGWEANIYTAENWTAMESAGAVFLPAAGLRDGTSVYDAGTYGYYWSSTAGGEDYAYYVDFNSDYLGADGNGRYGGQSVRLVRQVE